jgi:hypothetical protein
LLVARRRVNGEDGNLVKKKQQEVVEDDGSFVPGW